MKDKTYLAFLIRVELGVITSALRVVTLINAGSHDVREEVFVDPAVVGGVRSGDSLRGRAGGSTAYANT